MHRWLISVGLLVLGVVQVVPAGAAEVTDVADAADMIPIGTLQRGDPFDLYIGSTFEMILENGKITREPIDRPGLTGGCVEANARDCLPVDELRYKRSRTLARVKGQVGLYQDLALTFGWSYVLADSLRFRYARGVGPSNSTIDPQTGDPNDTLFSHSFRSKHAGVGPFELGMRWGVLNDERDDSKPAWVLLFNWQTPWGSPTYRVGGSRPTDANPGPVGDGVHRLTFGTALSKRIGNFDLIGIDPNANRRGYIDPYMEFKYTLPIPQRGRAEAPLLKSKTNDFGNRPSHLAEFNAGFEVVPIEDLKNSRRVAVDIGLRSAFISEGRNYSLLTDPLRELTFTEQHLYVGGALGFIAQAADFVRIRAGFEVGNNTEHFLTNEDVGKDKNNDNQVLRPQDDPQTLKDELNPYFCGNDPNDMCSTKNQPSYDQVGFRFKDEEHVVLKWFINLMLTF